MNTATLTRVPEFTVTTERCDACGSKAYSMAVKHGKYLYFCGHHTNKHYDALDAQGWYVNSRLDVLTKQAQSYKKATDDNF